MSNWSSDILEQLVDKLGSFRTRADHASVTKWGRGGTRIVFFLIQCRISLCCGSVYADSVS